MAGCAATAPIVAKSFGVSTPLRGTGGAFAAGASVVVMCMSMSDLHWFDELTDALACPEWFDRASEDRLGRPKAGKGQAPDTRRINPTSVGAVLDQADNRIAWRDTALLLLCGAARARSPPCKLHRAAMDYIAATWVVRKTPAEYPAIRRVSRRNVRGTSD